MKWEIETDKKALIDLVRAKAKLCSINPSIVLATIEQESNFQPLAMRYEPQFRYFFKPDVLARANRISLATEVNAQQCSWGLMQIMGAVARELGYEKEMPLLLTPEINIQYGCLKLEQLLTKYSTIDNAVSSYNQGSPRRLVNGQYRNQEYVTSVLEKMKRWEFDLVT